MHNPSEHDTRHIPRTTAAGLSSTRSVLHAPRGVEQAVRRALRVYARACAQRDHGPHSLDAVSIRHLLRPVRRLTHARHSTVAARETGPLCDSAAQGASGPRPHWAASRHRGGKACISNVITSHYISACSMACEICGCHMVLRIETAG